MEEQTEDVENENVVQAVLALRDAVAEAYGVDVAKTPHFAVGFLCHADKDKVDQAAQAAGDIAQIAFSADHGALVGFVQVDKVDDDGDGLDSSDVDFRVFN